MVRLLYIASGPESAQSGQIFECMRRDMATAAVELTYERRSGERRNQDERVDPERRQSDRRQRGVEAEIERMGWARVQVE